MLRNDADSWGTPAKFFHWVMAALILGQIALGLVADNWPLSPLKLTLFVWHKSLGMLILALAALRIGWRLGNPAPALPGGTAPWERRAAQASHFLLYALMILLPVTGWVVNSAANVPFQIFWTIPLPAIVAPDKGTADLAALAHRSLFVLLSAVLIAHIGAALRHHFVKRNDVLARMLPGLGR
jgi:cytochrome b561